MQAAAAMARPAAAPQVTQQASTSRSSAMRRPAAACSSLMSTKAPAADCMACSTSGAMSEPPSAVTVPQASMTVRTPSDS